MTLLSTIIRASRQLGLTPPTAVMSSGDETWLQMVEWAQEVVDDACLRHDWTALAKTQTLTGDGVTTAFTLGGVNADYSRLGKAPALTRNGSTAGFWPIGPLDPPAYIGATTLPITTATPVYKIQNGVLTLFTAPAVGETYTVSYQSSKPIYSGSAAVATWTLDADTPLIPERLVLLGIVWRWKASKGLNYSEFMSSYERALETLASADWGLSPLELSQVTVNDEFGDVRVTV